MTVTVQTFRASFPEFGPSFDEPEVQFWLDLSAKLLNQERWSDLYDYGRQLFMAHNLSLSGASSSDVSTGQSPGQVKGATTSASVDKVSYSRDASSVMLTDAGHWNLTTYGIRYKMLVKMIGAGPLQVGMVDPISVSAWQGPGYRQY